MEKNSNSNTTHNSKNLETTRMPTKRGIDEKAVYIYLLGYYTKSLTTH